MSDVVARTELAKAAVEVFNAWNANEFNQDRMNDAVNDLCLQAQRDPRGLMANSSLTQIMSAIYYSYNLLYTICDKIPVEDIDGYNAWCRQVEEWMGANAETNSRVSGDVK